MNLRKVIISLSIMAILSFCTLNVAAALESKPTATIYDSHAINATTKQPTTLVFYAPSKAKTGESVTVCGYLTAANGTGIVDARICIQEFNKWGDGNWHYLSVVPTSGNYGYFNDTVVIFSNMFATKGGYHFRAVYDGDAQYERSMSNEEIISVS
ncbi:MAG TPA: hypothetical protein VEG44_02270 [Candidatus Acidoferrales bacterium]|nr:hypothetical protein [Candidatus Acidoferrales bacterium]